MTPERLPGVDVSVDFHDPAFLEHDDLIRIHPAKQTRAGKGGGAAGVSYGAR